MAGLPTCQHAHCSASSSWRVPGSRHPAPLLGRMAVSFFGQASQPCRLVTKAVCANPQRTCAAGHQGGSKGHQEVNLHGECGAGGRRAHAAPVQARGGRAPGAVLGPGSPVAWLRCGGSLMRPSGPAAPCSDAGHCRPGLCSCFFCAAAGSSGGGGFSPGGLVLAIG